MTGHFTPSHGPAAEHPVDRTALRVLAHPLRSRILAELRLLGRATSADLARVLDTNTGVTSYHVRVLADAGLVTDAPEPDDSGRGGTEGRRRHWRVTPGARRLDLDEPDPDDEAAAEWLSRDYVQHFAGKVQAWITRATEWPLVWQENCGLDDHLVLVTDVQLESLQNEMTALLAKYRRVGAGNPRAKRVTYYTCALPVDAPPRT